MSWANLGVASNVSEYTYVGPMAEIENISLFTPIPALFAAGYRVVPRGQSNIKVGGINERIYSWAALNENTATTLTAPPSIDDATSSIAEYELAIGWSSQAVNSTPSAVWDANVAALEQRVLNAALDLIGGATYGLLNALSGCTVVTTGAAATLAWSLVRSTAATIRGTFGANCPLMLIVSPKQWNELLIDVASTMASSASNVGFQRQVNALFNPETREQISVMGHMLDMVYESEGIRVCQTVVNGLLPVGVSTPGALAAVLLVDYDRAIEIYGEKAIRPAAIVVGRENPAVARDASGANIIFKIPTIDGSFIGISKIEQTAAQTENAVVHQYLIDFDAMVNGTASNVACRLIESTPS